ncbi:MAG: Thioredoxin reductase [Deltaproteobacteria bacterium ADurb.Bin510]|nr:MAG: Thioredoxin reductase [Deltaproteobacteria bacterium ADurb.Bin510]
MNEIHDVIIVGGGPAGLSAGIYAARARMKALLIRSAFQPSLITVTDDVENYPGFPQGLSGFELIDQLTRQAERFDLEIMDADVEKLVRGEDCWELTAAGQTLKSLSVIVATGARPRELAVPGERELTGRGVSYCATCDGPFYRGKDVVVVGGGDTAVQEALFLTKFASRVTVIHRRERLRATGILSERARQNDRISFEFNSVVEAIEGEQGVERLRLKNVLDGSTKQLAAEGAFIFVGYNPATDFAAEVVDLDKLNYIITDDEMRTSAEGVFAAGDCRRKLLRQVVTACGDGATAAVAAEHYVNALKGQTYGA